MGYAAGMVQGDPPAGKFLLASISFRALPGGATGSALFWFEGGPSPILQLTNGGANLLARAADLTLTVSR
jgi:hypothetical protein